MKMKWKKWETMIGQNITATDVLPNEQMEPLQGLLANEYGAFFISIEWFFCDSVYNCLFFKGAHS
jgi:hypothetical protein